MLKEIVEEVSSKPKGIGKAALKAVRAFVKKYSSSGKVSPNFPGYEWSIGGSVEMADPVVQKMFGELIDLKSRRAEPADQSGYNEYIGYWGKPGTGINSISTWKYDKRSKTKIYFEFTDDEEATKSSRGMI